MTKNDELLFRSENWKRATNCLFFLEFYSQKQIFHKIQFIQVFFDITILFIERNEMRFAKLTDSNNYKEWFRNIRNTLCKTKLWRIVTDKIIKSDDDFSSNFIFADRKKHAKELLQWKIDDDRFSDKIKKMCVAIMQLQLEDEWSDKKIWKELKTLCQSSEWFNKWVIMNRLHAITLISSKDMQNYEIKIEKIEEEITQLNITMKEFLIIKTINELKSRYESWVMLLSQEARKENKLFILKQLFDHLRQKEHRMSIFNVVIAINRV